MADDDHLPDTADTDSPEAVELISEHVDVDTWTRFTPEQKQRVRLMYNIAQQITSDTGNSFVLKGGTALMLAYGLPRYSTDLDFDGKHSGVDISDSIAAGATNAGIIGGRVNWKKNTDITSRHMLHYPESKDAPLKVEVSYRQANQVDEADITEIDGMRVYKIEKLAELKTAAFRNRLRARDIFDIDFIIEHYAQAVSDSDLTIIYNKVREIGMDGLANTMRDDEILRDYDIDGIVLRLADRVAELMSQRGL